MTREEILGIIETLRDLANGNFDDLNDYFRGSIQELANDAHNAIVDLDMQYGKYYTAYQGCKKQEEKLKQEYEHLLKIAKKMHLWIFLHSSEEAATYKLLGLTDEDNALLGYSGEFILENSEDE